MSDRARRDRLVQLLEPVITAEGLDLEDVTVTPAGRRRLVRVVVDCDGGVSLDHIAEASQAVSRVLDDTDVMGGGPYVLEVTSPGVDRPLTLPKHWRRAVGRLVKADLRDGTSVEGRVLAADESGVELEAAGTGGPRAFAYQDLAKGRVQVEFRRLDDADIDDIDHDGEDGDEG